MALNFVKAEFVRSAGIQRDFIRDGLPQFAFAGRSNVGKSSVINRLVGRKNLAYVGASPGKTTQVNYFLIDRRAYLVDLPGYGFAKTQEAVRKSWSDLVGGYIAKRRSLAGLVVVMDARRPFMPTDEWLIEFMRARPEVKMHWLLNKSDQLKTMQKRETLRMAKKRAAEFGPNVTVQLFSGLKKDGTEELAEVLRGWLALSDAEPTAPLEVLGTATEAKD